MMRDDEHPPDSALHASRPPSLPPESKVTLQLALCLLLGILSLIAFVGAVLNVVEKSTLGNILSLAAGGVLGLLTGGNRITR